MSYFEDEVDDISERGDKSDDESDKDEKEMSAYLPPVAKTPVRVIEMDSDDEDELGTKKQNETDDVDNDGNDSDYIASSDDDLSDLEGNEDDDDDMETGTKKRHGKKIAIPLPSQGQGQEQGKGKMMYRGDVDTDGESTGDMSGVDEDGSDYDDDDDEDEDPTGNKYLQKFQRDVVTNYIEGFHPEQKIQNYEEVLAMSTVVRNKDNVIIDDLHKTLPIMTKYERARILGMRAKQLNSGAMPMIAIPDNINGDGYIIAELELKEKKIPFIIRRPLPNGGFEFWRVRDLEVLV